MQFATVSRINMCKLRPPRMVEAAMVCVASRLGSSSPVPFTFPKLLQPNCLVCLVLFGLNENDIPLKGIIMFIHSRLDKTHQDSHGSTSLPPPPYPLPASPRAPLITRITLEKVRFESNFLGQKDENRHPNRTR